MNALVRVLPAIAAIALIVPAALAVAGPELQGERLLPDLDQETPTELILTKGRHGWRLGFRSAVRNIGDGPLIIDGHRVSRPQRAMDADQTIMRTEGPREVVEGVGQLHYVRSPDHQHWHLLGFDHYELRRPRGTRAIVRDRKTGFCLGDRYRTELALPGRSPDPRYSDRCGKGAPRLRSIREGISIGWGDNYLAHLEGQELEITSLAPGRYVLVHRVNAARDLRESDYTDNVASMAIELGWPRGRMQPPRVDIVARCPGTATCP
jgi:hypothetical protein